MSIKYMSVLAACHNKSKDQRVFHQEYIIPAASSLLVWKDPNLCPAGMQSPSMGRSGVHVIKIMQVITLGYSPSFCATIDETITLPLDTRCCFNAGPTS